MEITEKQLPVSSSTVFAVFSDLFVTVAAAGAAAAGIVPGNIPA